MSRSTQPVLIASDHAGYAFKCALQKLMPQWTWKDLGPFQEGEKVDYPDFATRLCEELLAQDPDGKKDLQGILICGSGIGMSIAANKVSGIRAALVENPISARLSREHNHANILCLGARFLAPEYGVEIVGTWLKTPFTQDARHAHRIQKIHKIEKK
mgnify:CR=1 FL=1